MREVEKLRALLAEAREYIIATGCPDDAMLDRIDAALAEPVGACSRCETLRQLADTAAAEQGLAQRRMMEAQAQRDEARAHLAAVEKLLPREEYLSDKPLAENLAGWVAALRRDAKERSEFAAAETGHANRWAERAHKAEAEVERLGKALTQETRLSLSTQRQLDEARAEVRRTYKELSESIAREAETYERRAEAMREAAASCVGSDTALPQTYRSVLEGRIRDLPVPEDKP